MLEADWEVEQDHWVLGDEALVKSLPVLRLMRSVG